MNYQELAEKADMIKIGVNSISLIIIRNNNLCFHVTS